MHPAHNAPWAVPTAHGTILRWDFSETGGNEVVLDGMTQDFTWVPIQSFGIGSPGNVLSEGDYIKFRCRVLAGGIPLFETEPVWNPHGTTNFRNIELKAVKSYRGGTISFRDGILYDAYRLYASDGTGKVRLVSETESFQSTGPWVTEGTVYFVEGYLRDEKTGDLVLAGFSGDWECRFSEPVQRGHVLSVIVPCYAQENFVSGTIDSILLQSFDRMEIICIDDVAPDTTPAILDWYAERYPCIRVVHCQSNGGVSMRRNTGLGLATGEWVAFVDGDDMLHHDMYRLLYDAAVAEGSDVAIARTVIREDFGKKKTVLECRDNPPVRTYTYDEMMASRGKNDNVHFVAVWNKIVRTDVARRVHFPDPSYEGEPERMIYEDTAYTDALYYNADRFTMVRDAYYVWEKRQRQTIGSLSTNSEKLGLKHAHVWECWFESVIFPVRFCPKDRKAAAIGEMTDKLLKKYAELKGHENKNTAQKACVLKIKSAIEEFDLMHGPYAKSHPDVMSKLLFIKKL